MDGKELWRAKWLEHAAEVAETLTDAEILSLGRRLREPIAYWLRANAKENEYVPVEFSDEKSENLDPVNWVMRLIIEERNHTMKGIQLGPFNVQE